MWTNNENKACSGLNAVKQQAIFRQSKRGLYYGKKEAETAPDKPGVVQGMWDLRKLLLQERFGA